MTERKWTPCAAQSAEYHAGYEQALRDTAAPELYEALEWCINALEYDYTGSADDCEIPEYVRTALANARG